MFESLEKSLKDIKENIERVVKDRKANLVEIKQQHLKSMNNIKDTRQKINSRLDELEQHMIDNLNSTETQLKLKIKTLLNKLSEKKNEIEILKINLMSVKQHGSNLQAFIGSKMLEKDVTEELKYVQNISEDDGFSQFGLKCQMDDKITDILSKIIAFGSVSIKSSQSSIVFTVDQEKQAQMFTVNPTRSRPVDDITASFVGEFKVPAGNTKQFVTGSSVFPDGRMIFAECFNDNRLVIVCNDRRLVTEIPFSPRSPFDVTCIDNNTVAVTTYRDNTIMVVDTQNKQISKTIMSDECRGITFNQGHIIYCSKGKGIVAIQLSNYTVCTIVEDCKMTNDCSYIKTFEKNIYYTGNANTVKCYSIKGVKLWEYKDE
ncbi:Hypothetical predicted protein [Mytilus galloprovincialis]|nr:Hypothetical predicted protein [Mytilus galloprovincialis]